MALPPTHTYLETRVSNLVRAFLVGFTVQFAKVGDYDLAVELWNAPLTDGP